MFVVEALYPFSAIVLKQQQQAEQTQQKDQEKNQSNVQENDRPQNNNAQHSQAAYNQGQSQNVQQSQLKKQGNLNNQDNKEQQSSEISYLTFQKGDKILVLQSYENGWWYGNTIKQPDVKGFFPSNYVQVSNKPKPPPPPSAPLPDQQDDGQVFDPNEDKGIDWVQNQLKNINQGPIKSDYYLRIKGYKNIKIDDKNQNVLKGDHVKFDVSTGLAKVPIKDQAPAAKAVRQMGYYFDYHQWVQQRNKHPGHKARPDPKKKKIKKLNLKGMK